MSIGRLLHQAGGYKAFVPSNFPPDKTMQLSPRVQLASDAASRALGKLDGVAELIPDIDFFTYMYVRKEAALSSNIEGTMATMHDALKADIHITEGVPRDVENILHYINALNYGLERLRQMPLTSRVIREVHHRLMAGTQEGIGKTPGEFRVTQNWINGTRPDNANFVPPPPTELSRCIGDLENFINKPQPYSPLVQAALIHAQFETIHPFLDGNGRTGRLLIALELCNQGVLEHPILYLSEYFKRHRDRYFALLSDYHDKGDVENWLLFFLEGVKEVAKEATILSKAIVALRDQDMSKVYALGARQAPSAVKLLMELYKQPIIDVAAAEKVTKLSRPAANALVKRFIEIGILTQPDMTITYGRAFSYDEYLVLFN